MVTYEEIIEELEGMKSSWAKHIEKVQKELADYRKEYAKCEMLIDVLKERAAKTDRFNEKQKKDYV